MKWAHPPIIKIYEALGAVADGRVEIEGDGAKVFSSSRNKFYTVTYDPAAQAIMVNDNGSFYQGYLGYPAIAFLLLKGELKYDLEISKKLKGVAWKDINQKFKNNFDKALEYILQTKTSNERAVIEKEVERINMQLKDYDLLGPKVRPPEGY